MAPVTPSPSLHSLPPPPEGKQYNSKIRAGDADMIKKCQGLAVDMQEAESAYNSAKYTNRSNQMWKIERALMTYNVPPFVIADIMSQISIDALKPKLFDDIDETRLMINWHDSSHLYSEECLESKVSLESATESKRSLLAHLVRDAGKMAERFSDAFVATAIYDAKYAGEMVEKVAVPLVILGAVAFGVAKMVETGDTSTVQRVWAMMR